MPSVRAEPNLRTVPVTGSAMCRSMSAYSLGFYLPTCPWREMPSRWCIGDGYACTCACACRVPGWSIHALPYTSVCVPGGGCTSRITDPHPRPHPHPHPNQATMVEVHEEYEGGAVFVGSRAELREAIARVTLQKVRARGMWHCMQRLQMQPFTHTHARARTPYTPTQP